MRGRATVEFWWLRLARVYPVHVVMLVVAGMAVVAQARTTGDALDRDWMNPIDFAKNLLLIQEWGANPQRGWNFVAWSLSMEWLAYLLFPILILALWKLHQRVGTAVLVALWGIVLAPLIAYGLTTGDAYYTDNWGSTIRILTEFTAGAITYLIVVRLLPDEKLQHPAGALTQRWATVLSFALPALVIAGSMFLANWASAQPPQGARSMEAEPLPPYFHLLLVPLLITWIGALALSRGPMSRFLSTRAMVLGGFISYALYMTHLVWFGLWRAGMNAIGVTGGPVYAAATLGLVAGALLVAWLMWRLVEEPAREWMRGITGARRRPTEEAGESIAESDGPADTAAPIEVPSGPNSDSSGDATR